MAAPKKVLATCLLLGTSYCALAADTRVLSTIDPAAYASAVRAGDIDALATITEFGCTSTFRTDHKPTKLVSERAIASDELVTCLKTLQGLGVASAQSLTERAAVEQFFAPQIEAAEKVKSEDDSETKFLGLTWGVGFGYSFSEDDAVDSAVIVDNVVRVASERKEQPRALLEFHKYFWCNKGGTDGTRGCGPFIAVAATEDKVLSGVGIGLMYGRKSKAEDSDGFSIGVGVLLDDKVKDLADGFEENQAPPEGETTVRYLEKARWSALLFVTRTF